MKKNAIVDEYLQDNWNELTKDYSFKLSNQYFESLVEKYTSSGRHYHNLSHISELLHLTDKYITYLTSPICVRFSIWYHDAIYNPLRNNNELKSAQLMQTHISKFGIETSIIENCYQMIVATKTYQIPNESNNFDTQFLLDIDLLILAASKEEYLAYTQKIRKEFYMYPDFMFKKGRKNALLHFQNSERIFKTDLFYAQFEHQARENIQFEIDIL